VKLHNFYSAASRNNCNDKVRERELDRACSTGIHRDISWESQKEDDDQEDLYVVGKTILKWIFEKMEEVVRIELIWLRIGTSGGFF
jgi:hypothetical protein